MRLQPYSYRGWRVHHYLKTDNLPEQFYAYLDGTVIRESTKDAVEDKIDEIILKDKNSS